MLAGCGVQSVTRRSPFVGIEDVTCPLDDVDGNRDDGRNDAPRQIEDAPTVGPTFDGPIPVQELDPAGLDLIATLAVDVLAGRCDAVGGPTSGADPITAAIGLKARERGVPLRIFFTRKEARATACSVASRALPSWRGTAWP